MFFMSRLASGSWKSHISSFKNFSKPTFVSYKEVFPTVKNSFQKNQGFLKQYFSSKVFINLRKFSQTKNSIDVIQLKRNKIIGTWLLVCSGATFVTISIGGITRLTESGLSMVNWHPFKEVPPFSQIEWEKEFEKYQQFPEFKIKNKEITLDQFKWIWYMEYTHRTLGRAIGAFFFLPAAYFWSKKWFNRPMKIRTMIFGTLLAFQGFLGWYMVKSGLEQKEVYSHQPRVSQYRLAAHLGTAMAFYSLIFWNALTNIWPEPDPKKLPSITNQLIRFKKIAGSTKLFIFITAISGAFVAGLDAGLVYNSWPMMADRWIPSDILAHSPTWKNFFENPTMVQFNHRHLGELTGLLVLGLWAYSLRLKLPTRARIASNLLALAVATQVILGISTLLYFVPTELASAHQTNAMITLTMALWLSKELKWIKKITK